MYYLYCKRFNSPLIDTPMTKFTFQIPGSSHSHPAYKKSNVAKRCTELPNSPNNKSNTNHSKYFDYLLPRRIKLIRIETEKYGINNYMLSFGKYLPRLKCLCIRLY